ncbi:MAG: DNA alkylation repair protein [Anaerolineales bacterium]|nr:DNA alkylation repair protein [Anaerolineales bacterium]
MEENFALKDIFNHDTVGKLSKAVAAVFPGFPEKVFLEGVFDKGWEERALKERVRHITETLRKLLPQEYREALNVLTNALPQLFEQGFEKMVFPDFVELYGLEDWDQSILALEFFTQHVSAEFAIRPFIDRYQEKTLSKMLDWTTHHHPGVRRLASEGCRPRLPWGMRLKSLVSDPSPILPILELLKDDEREEIRRSVANNLNDISKDHPEIALKVLEKWQEPGNDNRTRLIKHALRTLIKSGHPGALELVGFSNHPKIKIENISLEPIKIHQGDKVHFSFEILSTGKEEQRLMIDYIVHFMRANGKQNPKVFKLSQKSIQPGERIQITKKHSFQPISTRKYYPGKQTFQPQVNGQVFGGSDLFLE